MTRNAQGGFTLVELLVVVMLLSVIGATTTSVIISTMRTEQLQSEMQSVMDDGRISLQRIRKEVRAARRLLPTSCEPSIVDCAPSTRLHFWVDQNQDAAETPDEIVCYLTESIGTDQYQLVRWTRDKVVDPAVNTDCTPGDRPGGAQVIARTLVPNHDSDGDGTDDLSAPFVVFEPDPTADPADPPTRNIGVLLRLEVQTGRDFQHFDVESIIRLRNVA